MANYKTPGVYVEEVSVFPPSVAQVETAIPAFIGYTATAPAAQTPKRIVSLKEYEQYFGKANSEAITLSVTEAADGTRSATINPVAPGYFMYYQMQMYFDNGGGPCYIVPVDAGGYGSSPNQSDIEDAIDALEGVDEPTIIVIVDSTDSIRDDLNAHALGQAGKLMDRVVVMYADNAGSPAFNDFRTNIGTTYLSYGAAYYPKLNTTLVPYTEDSDVTIDYTGHAADTAALSTLAESGNANNDESLYRELKGLLTAELEKQALELEPTAAVAGVYAYVDSTRGVWKAPANVSLRNVKGLADNVTDEAQQNMNVDPSTGKSVNAVRAFHGKGVLVWGARTLAGNDNEWRYISVRRFYNMVEESVKKATGAFVFEPNNANTWVKVRAMIENFLTLQWRAGALAGAKAEDAFFVRVGLGQTMDANDILEGRMIVEIGMAAVRPAEFIILRFSHMMQQS